MDKSEDYFGKPKTKAFLAFLMVCGSLLLLKMVIKEAIWPLANTLENVVTGNQVIVLNWIRLGLEILIGIAIAVAAISLALLFSQLLDRLGLSPEVRRRQDATNAIKETRDQLDRMLLAMDKLLESAATVERRITELEEEAE